MRIAILAGAGLLALAPASAQETITYSYDGRGRLVKTEHGGTVNDGVSSCYAYDDADNRTGAAVETTSTCTIDQGGGSTSPSFAINNGSSTEGTNVGFTVTRSGSTAGSHTVDYATSNGTAVAGSDYTAKSGTLTFLDGVATRPIAVATTDDSTVESSEAFYVTLSSPSGTATITTAQGTGTIVDNDSGSPVSFSISSNAAVTEGSNSVFTITKTGTATTSLTVGYATANATAVAPGDYTAKSGSLTFTTAQASKTVSVVTVDDGTVESAETFKMTLSSPTGGATIGTGTATATLNDNDSAGSCSGVSYTVNNVSATEADNLSFTVTKAGITSSSCSVNYATANVTAFAPDDYVAASGALTFTSAQTTKAVNVQTLSNGFMTESTETMVLNLSGATGGATISDSQGIGTIFDDGGGGCPTCLQGSEPGTDEGSGESSTTTDETDGLPDATEPTDTPPPPGAA